MAHRFSPAAERRQADAVARHQDKVKAMLRDSKKLRKALLDYFADRDLDPFDALADYCVQAQDDQTEAGRELSELAKNAAHECARWQLGDDMEAVEPAEPYKPTFRPVDVSKMAAQLMGIPTDLQAHVDAARGIPVERK